MNILGLGTIIEGVGKIADDLITTDKERLEIALEERKLDVGLLHDQTEVNKEEAKSGSLFVAGWRPFIGWVGGVALAYQFLLYPLLIWLWAVLQAYQIIPCNIGTEAVTATCSLTPPPLLPTDTLFTIVCGMLGIGSMRSFDKLKKTDTKRIDK